VIKRILTIYIEAVMDYKERRAYMSTSNSESEYMCSIEILTKYAEHFIFVTMVKL
jgi:hypothetical protein